jgi:hypothetical protein
MTPEKINPIYWTLQPLKAKLSHKKDVTAEEHEHETYQ